MKKTKLQFKAKNVYGNLYFYPENEAAKIIVSVTPRMTMDKEQLKKLSKIFDVETFSDFTPMSFEKNTDKK